jgi:hypothetical protein
MIEERKVKKGKKEEKGIFTCLVGKKKKILRGKINSLYHSDCQVEKKSEIIMFQNMKWKNF